MGPQVLIIPALFVAICVSFILLQSCYHRWKVGAILRRKRDAAKISLVNILQMTNASLITPAWSTNGTGKSKIRPTVLVSDETACSKSGEKKGEKCTAPPSAFDSRKPNILSFTTNNQQNLPPPCYEDLYGPGGVVFTFKSLSPERDELPPFSSQMQHHNGQPVCPNIFKAESTGQYPYSNSGNNPCLLQVPSQDTPVISPERRNSSAVLYL